MINQILFITIFSTLIVSPVFASDMQGEENSGTESFAKRARVVDNGADRLLQDNNQPKHATSRFPDWELKLCLNVNLIVPRELQERILLYITEREDINALSLVSHSYCNWVDSKKHLRVSNSCGSIDELIDLLKYKTGLRSLDLSAGGDGSETRKYVSDYITDEAIGTITEIHPNLTSLDLWECEQITDRGLAFIAENCTSLTSLAIGGVDSNDDLVVTDLGLAFIIEKCTKLKRLDLHGCQLFTDKSLALIAEKCRNLTYLDLAWSKLITARGLALIVEKCTKLTYLNFSICKLIDYKGLALIGEKCQNPTSIELEFCEDYITKEGVAAFKAKYPLIRTFL